MTRNTPALATLRHAMRMLAGRAPGQLIIQITDQCNAACPQCNMRVSAPFKRSTLSVDDAKRTIDHAAANGVAALSLTGGEPLLYLDDVATLLKYARAAGIRYTRTGTNGFLFMHPERANFERRVNEVCEKLLDAGVYTFWISIDSADFAVHESMRGLPNVIAGVRRALPIFHRNGLYPSVNLGINRNVGGVDFPVCADLTAFYEYFRISFRRFYENVIELGFTIVNCCYPMSVPTDDGSGLSAVYQASADSALVQFTAREKAQLFRALYETIPEYRSRIRIFSPRASLLALLRQYSAGTAPAPAACRGGIDFFFVDSRDGNAYPFGYRGAENLGKFWDLDLNARGPGAVCNQCDWECWRDPSELFGPVLGFGTAPWQWLQRLRQDPLYFRTWRDDLLYMRDCDFFNCTTPPRYDRLDRYPAARETSRRDPMTAGAPGLDAAGQA